MRAWTASTDVGFKDPSRVRLLLVVPAVMLSFSCVSTGHWPYLFAYDWGDGSLHW